LKPAMVAKLRAFNREMPVIGDISFAASVCA
jgi:hypothetical protein